MTDFWAIFFSSGGVKMLLWIFAAIVILGILAYLIWLWIRNKFIFKYKFGVVNFKGRIIKKSARVFTNKYRVKKFMIDGYPNNLLDIREPNSLVDNTPTRLVAFDGSGNLVYLDNIKRDKENNLVNIKSETAKIQVDTKKYLETSLTPQEREGIANNIVDLTIKHGKMPEEIKWMLGSAVLIVIIVMVGIFIQGKMLVKQYEINSGDIQVLKDATKALENYGKIQQENLKLQEIILGYVTEGKRNISLTGT